MSGTAEHVILVDGSDKQVGLEEKVRCHLPDGRLHRAFTALIFDQDGRLLLTKRAKDKMLWPGYWDGTFASHPRESETFLSSAQRRMPEELGISCSLDYVAKFEYHVPYKDVGSENEVCGTLIGMIDGKTQLYPVKSEIDETRWISAAELNLEPPDNFCPWMLIALVVLSKSGSEKLAKYGLLADWLERGTQDALLESVRAHLPDEKWRITP